MGLLFSLRMSFRALRLGVGNLLVHKLRSVLTTLGIVFGVCSVVSMLAIGEGASREVQEQIGRLGSKNIILQSMKPPQDANAQSQGSQSMVLQYGLTYEDAERLVDTLPAVRVVLPIKSRTEDLWYGSRKATSQLLATIPWFIRTNPVQLESGRFINALDIRNAANVCVLGSSVARQLFLFEEPIGKAIRVGSDAYRVVGIVDESGRSAKGGAAQGADLPSQTANCFIPLTTLRARQGDYTIRREQGSFSAEKIELNELVLGIERLEDVLPTAKLVESVMSQHHEKQDYKTIVPLRLLEEAERTQRIFSVVLGSIAAISLLVGGIGIMNIMLATVSERTREIGIRRALGARQRDIMLQFLFETLALSVGGGLLGIGLGVAIPWLVSYLTQIRTVLTPFAFILSFAVSVLVGLVFGLYPARRAARMDPIEALRYE